MAQRHKVCNPQTLYWETNISLGHVQISPTHDGTYFQIIYLGFRYVYKKIPLLWTQTLISINPWWPNLQPMLEKWRCCKNNGASISISRKQTCAPGTILFVFQHFKSCFANLKSKKNLAYFCIVRIYWPQQLAFPRMCAAEEKVMSGWGAGIKPLPFIHPSLLASPKPCLFT